MWELTYATQVFVVVFVWGLSNANQLPRVLTFTPELCEDNIPLTVGLSAVPSWSNPALGGAQREKCLQPLTARGVRKPTEQKSTIQLHSVQSQSVFVCVYCLFACLFLQAKSNKKKIIIYFLINHIMFRWKVQCIEGIKGSNEAAIIPDWFRHFFFMLAWKEEQQQQQQQRCRHVFVSTPSHTPS